MAKDEQGRMIEDALKEVTKEAEYIYPDKSMPWLILTRVREAYVSGYMNRWSEEMKAQLKEKRKSE